MNRSEVAIGALACVLVSMLAGCQTPKGSGHGWIERDGPPPSYQQVVSRFNTRVSSLDRLYARAVLRVAFLDERGETRREQGNGILQVVGADRLALSVTKTGQRLFWFGCDPEKYWWIELYEQRLAYVGRHDRFGPDTGERLGLAMHPLAVIATLGITPLPEQGPGATQWGTFGLGVTAPMARGGVRRLWLDAQYRPIKIELFDADRMLVLVADLDKYEAVELHGQSGPRPFVASRIDVAHQRTGTQLTLDLFGMKTGPINDGAFVLNQVASTLGVDRFVDLDRRAAE